MSLIAIYVYAPTTFQIEGGIDCNEPSKFASQQLTSDQPVELPPSVYRLSGSASISPASGSTFEIVHIQFVTTNGSTKKPFPDPPIEATQLLGFGTDQAHTFFGGLGASGTF